MNNVNQTLYLKLKRHQEGYASMQLAKKLHCLLPINDETDLRPFIGNGKNRNNIEAIQTWIKETMTDFPSSSFELTLDHWHERLVCELLNKLNTGDEV
jgi:hypothetical protein